jgi:hypothetical protein
MIDNLNGCNSTEDDDLPRSILTTYGKFPSRNRDSGDQAPGRTQRLHDGLAETGEKR